MGGQRTFIFFCCFVWRSVLVSKVFFPPFVNVKGGERLDMFGFHFGGMLAYLFAVCLIHIS